MDKVTEKKWLKPLKGFRQSGCRESMMVYLREDEHGLMNITSPFDIIYLDKKTAGKMAKRLRKWSKS